MIWVRSCGKIHEFPEADQWDAAIDGSRLIVMVSSQRPFREGTIAEFTSWDWVRISEPGTTLLDDKELQEADEPESTEGYPLAECGKSPALEC